MSAVRRSRRQLLRDSAAVGLLAVGAPLASACGSASAPAPATPEPKATPLPPPESTSIRFSQPATCDAPFWVVDDLLRDEGFTEVKMVAAPVAAGEADVGLYYANYLVTSVEAGVPLLALGGIHTGCIELWAAPGITSIRDLRGRTYQVLDRSVSVGERKVVGLWYGLLASILAHIGVDPADLKLVDVPANHNVSGDYVAGRSDTVFLPVHQGPLMRRRADRRGSVILDTTVDKPWSQHYCCMLTANRDWAKANPVATKRATRAFMRASDLVVKDRQAAVTAVVSKGIYRSNAALTPEILSETIAMLSYDWREFDPAETLRFFALRLKDGNLMAKTPQQILDEGSDLAYARQLAKELKP